MIELDFEALTYVYNKIPDTFAQSITFSASFLHAQAEELKDLTFNIFYDGIKATTSIQYKDKPSLTIEHTNILEHLQEIKNILNTIDFCILCDEMKNIKDMYNGKCLSCTFIKSFRQDNSDKLCPICQENIENDWFKSKCCRNYYHKSCRYKVGRWSPCPLCRIEDYNL